MSFQRYSSFKICKLAQWWRHAQPIWPIDISANLYQKCLILCSKILLNVLHNTSATVWLSWQHTTAPRQRNCRLLPNKIENTIIQQENYNHIFPTYVDELIFVNSRITERDKILWWGLAKLSLFINIKQLALHPSKLLCWNSSLYCIRKLKTSGQCLSPRGHLAGHARS